MLQVKVEVLDMLCQERSFAAVGRHCWVSENTVRCIKKNEALIQKTISVSLCSNAKIVSTVKNKTIFRIASALAMWFTDC